MYIFDQGSKGKYMPKCAVCTYTYDYVPYNVTDYIAVTSYITYVIAVILRTTISGWNIMLGCDDYTTAHHCILVVVVVITPHSIIKF